MQVHLKGNVSKHLGSEGAGNTDPCWEKSSPEKTGFVERAHLPVLINRKFSKHKEQRSGWLGGVPYEAVFFNNCQG